MLALISPHPISTLCASTIQRRRAGQPGADLPARPGLSSCLVAAEGPKVVGVLRAELKERLFYEPHREGFITDFYILPEYRRKALGNDILTQASSELKKMGAQIVVADVPAQNEIANRFYAKRGFRALTNLLGKSP